MKIRLWDRDSIAVEHPMKKNFNGIRRDRALTIEVVLHG